MTQEEYLEEQIKTFPGYANPFWYERNVPKYNPEAEEAERIKYEWQKKRPNPVHQGTQPDIEIRWRYH